MNLQGYAKDVKQGQKGKFEALTAIQKTAPPDESKRIKLAYRIAFDFHAKHLPAPKTPADWQALTEQAVALSMQYDNWPLLQYLLWAVYSDLEDQAQAIHENRQP